MRYGVYAYRAADDRVLYVGQTQDIAKRDYTHRLSSHWRAEATSLDVLSVHATRREALDAERVAIRELEPAYNMRHNGVAIPRAKHEPRQNIPLEEAFAALDELRASLTWSVSA